MAAIAAYVVVGGLLLIMTYLVVRALARNAPDDREVDIEARPFPWPKIRYRVSARNPQLPAATTEKRGEPTRRRGNRDHEVIPPRRGPANSSDTVPMKLTYSSRPRAVSDATDEERLN